MRHRVKGRKLNRTASHRLATFRALATAIIREKKIKTTLAKAQELRGFIEPLFSRANLYSFAHRRFIARHIPDKEVLKELFSEIIPKVGDRPGGYTRVVKLGMRQGDAAEVAIIEFVDYNDVNSKPKSKSKKVTSKKEEIKDAVVVEESTNEVVEEKVEATDSEVQTETTEEKKEEVLEDSVEVAKEEDSAEEEK